MLNYSTNELIRYLDIGLGNVLNNFQGMIKNVSVAAIATPIIIIASASIVYHYAKKAHKCKNHEIVYTRSMSLGALHGGKLAFHRLIDYHHARADTTSLNAAEKELKSLLAEEQPDFNKLQTVVAKLEMSGKEGVAVRILEQEVEKAKRENKSHEAYEIEMLLVEMLIYKGDYKKALNCECLNHEQISDARRPLYKAIIHVILNNRKEASKCWDEFVEVGTNFQSPPSFEDHKLHKDISDFNEFEKLVEVLKKDITKVHKPRLQTTNLLRSRT